MVTSMVMRMKEMATTEPIYVETRINHSVDEVWAHTQTPEVHQRWDIRFTTITYLEVIDDEPQRFVYSTKVAPGLAVNGRGETLGEKHRPDGTAYSGLKFWSDHPVSLIKEGAGFWRYVPTENGVRFLTRYDYRVRWGLLGRTLDRFLFRPIFGWATAWSFDRLRLWIERGITPERSRNQTLIHLVSVLALACVWIYHGIGSQLLFRGLGNALPVPTPLGVGQALLGLVILGWWRQRFPFLVTVLVGAAAPVGVFGSAAVIALAGVALLTRNDLPSGRLPLRRAPQTTSLEETQI